MAASREEEPRPPSQETSNVILRPEQVRRLNYDYYIQAFVWTERNHEKRKA
jgi:hypothetical protein